jgi:Fe-S-cluster containining protein
MIYAAVPRIACKGLCQHSCGPIMASPREMAHFERMTGKPFPDANAMLERAIKDRRVPSCPHLNVLGQCDAYQHRPLLCRLWGVVPGMPCQHGCQPERQLSERESRELLRQAE